MRIRDTDARRGTFDTVFLDQAICDAYLALQGRLPPANLYTASAFTIAAGGDTFTLPATVSQYTGNDGGAEYAGDFSIQLNSTKRFLVKVTVQQIDAMRSGVVATALAIPQYYALWEENDQDLQGRCWPGAQSAEACNLFRSMMADDMRDFIGSGADDLDDVEVLFSREAALALVYYVAAELVASMPEDELKMRKLNPNVAQLWLQRSEEAIYREYARRLETEGVGRVERWVS